MNRRRLSLWSVGLAVLAWALVHTAGMAAGQDAGEGGSASSRERMRRDRMEDDGAPRVGELAPPFVLQNLEGDRQVDLASLAGAKPVVLFFGSYT